MYELQDLSSIEFFLRYHFYQYAAQHTYHGKKSCYALCKRSSPKQSSPWDVSARKVCRDTCTAQIAEHLSLRLNRSLSHFGTQACRRPVRLQARQQQKFSIALAHCAGLRRCKELLTLSCPNLAHGRLRNKVPRDMQKDELPWERKERLQNLADKESGDLPFAVYLLASAIVAIAAVSFYSK